MKKDGVRLSERAIIGEYHSGDLRRRVDAAKFLGARAAARDIDLDPFIWFTEIVEKPSDFETVARVAVTVDADHGSSLGCEEYENG
jgi:hypothetical protein